MHPSLRRPCVAAVILTAAVLVSSCKSNRQPSSTSARPGDPGVFFLVSVFQSEGGTVSSGADRKIDCGPAGNLCGPAQFGWDETATLTATAADDYKFSGWAGDCTGTGECKLDTSEYGADKYVVAVFEPKATYRGTYFAVSVTRPQGGTITSPDGQIRCGSVGDANRCGPALFRWSDSVTLTAAGADSSYVLLGWTGACSGTGACTLSTAADPSDKIVGAAFGRAAAGGFTRTADMAVARSNLTATLLPGGKVLVAGGWKGAPVGDGAAATAELYDVATKTFAATASLSIARYAHTATLLPNGKVLVAGGAGGGGSALSSAELFDPVAGAFARTGDLTTPRAHHTATLLPNGKVLLAGGQGSSAQLASAELYDPVTGTFTAVSPLSAERNLTTATLLGSGKVLFAGGYGGYSPTRPTAELYDPTTGMFSLTGGLILDREAHVAAPLPNGRVLVAGGVIGPEIYTPSAELYDPATGTFAPTSAMSVARFYTTATALQDGRVLVAGGTNGMPLASAEVYDPGTGKFAAVPSMTQARYSPAAALLPNGMVLVVGGFGTEAPLASAELYDPAAGTGGGGVCAAGAPSAATLNSWLEAHPAVAASIKWQTTFMTTVYDVPEAAKVPWPNWDPARKQALATAFTDAWTEYCGGVPARAPLPDPPENLNNTSVATDSPWVAVAGSYAWELYVRWVGHHLFVEIGGLVPWSVADYSPRELQVLFDSTAMMSRRPGDDFMLGIGSPGHGALVKRTSNLGATLPSSPDFAFGFFEEHGLPFASRLEAIAAALEWTTELRHFECDPGDLGCLGYGGTDQHWQYRGIPPLTRVVAGTTRSGSNTFAHWTNGCHGTTAVLRHLLRALNIPVEIIRAAGHSQAHFMTEHLYLDHGDNPYNLLFRSTGRPAVDLLIDEATYTTWFGTERENNIETGIQNIGRQVYELAGATP